MSVDELDRSFGDSASNILELTERLAKMEQPGLMCLCYSGDTRISPDPRVQQNIKTALDKHLACAFFVPVPPPPYQGPPFAWQIEGYWKRVWRSAISFSKNFKIALYAPREGLVEASAMPPFQSRFFLLMEPKGHEHEYDTALYLMLETEDDKQMHLIATKEGLGQYEPVVDWEQYFGAVLEAWTQTNKLPEGDCGNWRRWNEEKLALRSRTAAQDGPPAM